MPLQVAHDDFEREPVRLRIPVKRGLGQRFLQLPTSPQRPQQNGNSADERCASGGGDFATVRKSPRNGTDRMTLQPFRRRARPIGQPVNTNREPIADVGCRDRHETRTPVGASRSRPRCPSVRRNEGASCAQCCRRTIVVPSLRGALHVNFGQRNPRRLADGHGPAFRRLIMKPTTVKTTHPISPTIQMRNCCPPIKIDRLPYGE
jgi:hypothetical protein